MISLTPFLEEDQKQTALKVAAHYLQTTKQWDVEAFCLEIVGREGTDEAPIVILDGVYKADLQPQQRGGGQSVQLHIDVQKQQVVREFAFQ